MGFLDIFAWPFSYVFEFCYKIVPNYGAALILFALFVKIILLPLGIKQQKNQIKTAKLRPQMYIIEKKYAGRNDRATLQKKQQEILNLQTQAGASPMAGCLPLLIQLPIIFGLYEIIRKPLTWFSRFSEEVISSLSQITGVASTDEIQLIGAVKKMGADAFSGIEGFDFTKMPNLSMWGQDLSVKPSLSEFSWILFIPFIVFITTFASMKLTRWFMRKSQPKQTPDQELSMKIMDFNMPLIQLFFAFSFSAAIGLYWIYQTVFSLIQSVILSVTMPVPQFTEEELKKAEKEIRKNHGVSPDRETCRDENKPIRSLHYIDEDDEDVPTRVIKQPQKKTNNNVGRANLKDNNK